MRIGLLLSVALVSFTSAAFATDEEIRGEVRDLARQLADDELAARDDAERRLMEIGTSALAHLPKPNDRMPAEMLRRLQRIRQKLEVQQAEAATNGSRVTMNITEQPLSKVLAELEQLSGNRIVDFRDFRGQEKTDPVITLQVDDTPFWEALDQVLDQAGMSVYPYAHDDEGEPLKGVAFVANEDAAAARHGRANYQAAFRFEPVSVVARQNLRNAEASALEVQIETTWEPRLAPIRLTLLRDTVRAIDDQGNALANYVGGQSELDVYETAPVFGARFQLPARGVARIKTLTGQLNGLLPERIETFRFEKIKDVTNQQQQRAGATVILDRAGHNDAVWQVRILVRFDSEGEALESHLLDWVLRNEAYLEKSDGTKVDNVGFEKTRETGNEFGIAYVFLNEDGIEDLPFVYKTPAGLLQRQITFELTDLPLP